MVFWGAKGRKEERSKREEEERKKWKETLKDYEAQAILLIFQKGITQLSTRLNALHLPEVLSLLEIKDRGCPTFPMGCVSMYGAAWRTGSGHYGPVCWLSLLEGS